MRMTEITSTQLPTTTHENNNTTEATHARQNEALKRFTELTLYLLLLSILLIGMLLTGQLLTRLQKDALVQNHNYIPNENQETFKIKNDQEFWQKELQNIHSRGFYGSNESYRLFVSPENEIFCNNSLTPLGTAPTKADPNPSEYTKYLNDIFARKKPFIIEFRKQTKSLLFFLNRETLFFDRIFQLETKEFIGEILRRYYQTSFEGFLYDLKDKVKKPEIISLEIQKTRLEVFKYFLFLGAFNGFSVVLCDEFICVFGGRFQILLIGKFTEFLEEVFGKKKGYKLFLVGASADGIEFIQKKEENVSYLKYYFNRKNNETMKIKFLTVFGFGPLKKARGVFEEMRLKKMGVEKKWKEILKEGGSAKELVESFYGVETGWGVFDGVSLSDEMREAIPVTPLRAFVVSPDS